MIDRLCPICSAPGQACGDDHITAPVITSDTIKGVPMTSPDQPVELNEYDYYVGHVLITAQLSAEQAEAMGAKPKGQAEDPAVGEVPNKEAERVASQMKAPDEAGTTGTDPDALDKARTTRNRRAR